jgi:hypothetical protein
MCGNELDDSPWPNILPIDALRPLVFFGQGAGFETSCIVARRRSWGPLGGRRGSGSSDTSVSSPATFPSSLDRHSEEAQSVLPVDDGGARGASSRAFTMASTISDFLSESADSVNPASVHSSTSFFFNSLLSLLGDASLRKKSSAGEGKIIQQK